MKFILQPAARLRVFSLCLLLFSAAFGTPAAAQDKPAAPDKPDKAAPAAPGKTEKEKTSDNADVALLFTALDDIGELRVLIPLKLTAEELDKMGGLIADAQAEYNKKLTDDAAPIMRKAADSINAAKKKALAGTVAASDDVILKALADCDAKHKEADAATLKSLGAKLQALWTDAQYQAAAKVAREEQAKVTGSAAKGTDAQWFNLYVLRVIMGYPRLVPLLKEMKAAQSK